MRGSSFDKCILIEVEGLRRSSVRLASSGIVRAGRARRIPFCETTDSVRRGGPREPRIPRPVQEDGI